MTSALKWGILGTLLGACFPVLAFWDRATRLSEVPVPVVIAMDPLLWLLATGPVFLGLFGALGGRHYDQARRVSEHLELLVKQRTHELEGAVSRAAELADSRGELVEELNRNMELFQRAIEALDTAFAMYDADERLIICNGAFAELNHFPKDIAAKRPRYEDLVRLRCAEIPEFKSSLPEGTAFEQWLEARLAEFRNPTAPLVIWNGTNWIRLDDKKMPDGGTVSTRTDVTTLKQAEFEARLQEQRLKLAATSAGIGIWETDLETKRVVWDARMEEMYSFAPGTFPGTIAAWKSKIHPEDLARVEASIELSLAQGGSDFQDIYRIVLADGQLRHIDRRGSYTKGPRGELVRRLGVNMDITEHIEKAEALRAAVASAQAAAQAKTDFLATMSHEIRTPMNGVMGMTELLLETQLDPVQRQHAETIRACGEALLAIINDILDFSKMEAGKLQLEEVPFSVSQVASESVALFAQQALSKGVELSCSLPDIPLDVVGDPGRLRQVLLNLVSNAIKFTQRGEVKVRVSSRTATDSVLDVELEVSDTGIGMPPEYLARLGEAFSQADTTTTRQYGGTGLGLSICSKLIRLMRGSLTVRSATGEGSCFLVSLPLRAAAPAPSIRTQTAQAAFSVRLKRVLVAEDNVVNQRIIISMLKKCADEVDLAVDGREAYALFQKQEYDCVFMDGQMPNMDGLEATRLIRAFELANNRRRTPIIALTASAMATDRDVFIAGGMDEYVTKPVRTRDILAALTRVKAALTGAA